MTPPVRTRTSPATVPGTRGAVVRVRPLPRRSAALRAIAFLAIASIAAVAAGFLFTRWIERRTAAARTPTAKVVVAAVDLPLATALRRESLAAVDWPLASRPEGTASDPGELVGRVVVTPIVKGEAILRAKLASRESGSGLAAILPAGMRAAAVRVDDVVGVAGFLHPGDRVDVIVTMKPAEGSGVPPVSKIVLQDVRVLAVGKEIATKGKDLDRSIPATVATLMVTSEQSEKLALAAAKGQLLLTLRSSIDNEAVVTAGVTPPVLLSGAAGVAPRLAAPPARPPRRAVVPVAARGRAAAPDVRPAPAKDHVEILRGDLFEKRDFETGREP
jgi:pilus assembly protein CpaB